MKEEKVEKKYSNRVTKKTSHQNLIQWKFVTQKTSHQNRSNECLSLKKLPTKNLFQQKFEEWRSSYLSSPQAHM